MSRPIHYTTLIVLIAFVLFTFPTCGSSSSSNNQITSFTVATLNMYMGFDATSLLNGSVDLSNSTAVATAAGSLFDDYQNNEPDTRLSAIASAIVDQSPSIIGLQEAIVLSRGDTTQNDFVTELINNITSLGGPIYQSVSLSTFSQTLPAIIDGTLTSLTLVDRETILYKSDISCSALDSGNIFSSSRDAVTVLGNSITLTRGVIGIQCTIGENSFYVFSTHLDVSSQRSAQENQADELFDYIPDIITNVSLPVLLLGDFNAERDGSTNTYTIITNESFTDAYRQVNTDEAAAPGYTCCQENDLSNSTSQNNSRFDYVFYKGDDLTATGADFFADSQVSRQDSSGTIWPSDHFGVFVTFEFGSSL